MENAVKAASNLAVIQPSEAPVAKAWGTGLTLDEVLRTAQVLAASGYFRDATQTAQAAAKIMAGQELGIGPMQALTQIHIIEGKPSQSAGLVGAMIKSSGRYDYRVAHWDHKRCKLDFYERGKMVGPSEFTWEDAVTAGLTTKKNRDGSKNNWEKYPKAMLFARAITQGARAYCPDVFGGAVYTPDELGAEIDVDSEGNILAVSAPSQASTQARNVTQAGSAEKLQAAASGRKALVAECYSINRYGTSLKPDEMRALLDDITAALDEPAPFQKLGDVTDDQLRQYLNVKKQREEASFADQTDTAITELTNAKLFAMLAKKGITRKDASEEQNKENRLSFARSCQIEVDSYANLSERQAQTLCAELDTMPDIKPPTAVDPQQPRCPECFKFEGHSPGCPAAEFDEVKGLSEPASVVYHRVIEDLVAEKKPSLKALEDLIVVTTHERTNVLDDSITKAEAMMLIESLKAWQ